MKWLGGPDEMARWGGQNGFADRMKWFGGPEELAWRV